MNRLRMKLVFRLGAVGFSVSIGEIVEILESHPGRPGGENIDKCRFLLGETVCRRGTVPLHDLRRRMQLSSDHGVNDATILVLGDDSRCFGVIADHIDGIFPEAEFVTFSVPFQFVDGAVPVYERIDLWSDEPLVALDFRTLVASWGT
ncbi:MAG: chemotaxis protein CheW [Desulfuromonadales bacterium]|nr:chemotaxis protein CheW [Desulfuromonadales bacterium]MDT8422688.1 chemotaxis protein CheW [Desulfuromonadales bacterium]